MDIFWPERYFISTAWDLKLMKYINKTETWAKKHEHS